MEMGRSGACPPVVLMSPRPEAYGGAMGSATEVLEAPWGAAARLTVRAGEADEPETLCACVVFARRLRLTSIDTSVAKDTSSILDSYPSAEATIW